MLHYVVRRYTALQDVTLRCKTLHYVVRRYTTLWDVTLRCKTLRYVVRRYTTLWDVTLRCKTLRCFSPTNLRNHGGPVRNNLVGNCPMSHRYFRLCVCVSLSFTQVQCSSTVIGSTPVVKSNMSCQLPVVDPFHPSVMKFISATSDPECTGKPHGELLDGVLKFTGK